MWAEIMTSRIVEPPGDENVPRGKRMEERNSWLIEVDNQFPSDRDRCVKQWFTDLTPDEGILRIDYIRIAYAILILE